MKSQHIAMIVGGCLLVVFLGVASLGFIGYRAYRMATKMAQMPPALESVGIRSDAGVVDKSLRVTDARLGTVTDMVRGNLDGKPGEETGVAGENGALFLRSDGTPVGFVGLAGSGSGFCFVDVEGDGTTEYLHRGAWGSDVQLLDHSGAKVWSYGDVVGVDYADAGDLNGDGIMDFAVGFNGGGGLHAVNSSGTTVWKQSDGNVWCVRIADVNGDGVNEIVHSNAGGQLVVRNGSGTTLSNATPTPYFSHFTLCMWPDASGMPRPVYTGAGKVRILDQHAKVLASFDAPDLGELGKVSAATARLSSGGKPVLATLVTYAQWDRAVLYVHDTGTGKLLYEEILPECGGAVAALPAVSGNTDVLLVGGTGHVWQIAPSASSRSRK